LGSSSGGVAEGGNSPGDTLRLRQNWIWRSKPFQVASPVTTGVISQAFHVFFTDECFEQLGIG